MDLIDLTDLMDLIDFINSIAIPIIQHPAEIPLRQIIRADKEIAHAIVAPRDAVVTV